MNLGDAIKLYEKKTGIHAGVNFLTDIQGFRLDRTSVTPERARETFSLQSIEKLANSFALWVLTQTYSQWGTTHLSSDTAPETVKIVAQIDWSDDE